MIDILMTLLVISIIITLVCVLTLLLISNSNKNQDKSVHVETINIDNECTVNDRYKIAQANDSSSSDENDEYDNYKYTNEWRSVIDSINNYEDRIHSIAWGRNNKVCGSNSYATGWYTSEDNCSKYTIRVSDKELLDDISIYDVPPKEGDLALDFSTNTTYIFNGTKWNELVESTDEINVREIQF